MDQSHAALLTGVPGLDRLLKGGLLPRSLIFIVGPSGAGKTILASQAAFHAVKRGQQCLFLTTISEGQVKLLEHLRPLAFFDEAPIGKTLTLHPLPAIIGTDMEQAATALAKMIRERSAELVVIDGIQLILEDPRYRDDVPQFFATLSTHLSYLQSTVLITITGHIWAAEIARVLTTADIVLGLEFSTVGWIHQRRIEVMKHRGGPHLPGLHSYRIDAAGITISPRLESFSRPPQVSVLEGRAAFGIAKLDTLLRGGLPYGSIGLLVGAPGAGKTILGLHWSLAGTTSQEHTVMVSFEEHVEQLYAKARAFGLPLDAAITQGTIEVIYVAPVGLDPDAFAAELLEQLHPNTRRVVLDNCYPLLLSLGERAPTYLAALRDQLYLRGITTLLLADMRALNSLQIDHRLEPLSFLADNLLLIQQVMAQGAMHRMLAVLKMRQSAFDATLHEMVIDEQGLRMLTPSKSATTVLEDLARSNGLSAPHEDRADGGTGDDSVAD